MRLLGLNIDIEKIYSNLIELCCDNEPHNEMSYTSFGIFATISSVCTMYSVSNTNNLVRIDDLLFFYQSMLICSMLFVTYPVWPHVMKHKLVVIITWNFAVFYLLILCSTFCLFLSNFSHIQIVIFMVNMIVMAIVLTNWKLTFLFIMVGMYYGRSSYKNYMGIDNFDIDLASTHLILYSVLLSGAAIIIFFKPQHDELKWTAKTIEHFKKRLFIEEIEHSKAQRVKYNFLRNIEHELNTPLSSIMGFAQILNDNYSKLTNNERKAAVTSILETSERLHNFAKNMIYLSKLLDSDIKITRVKTNFSKLIAERVIVCERLYSLNDQKQEIVMELQDNIMIDCDIEYMKQTLDNLIINAIKYCPQGVIKITLKGSKDQMEFVILDEGIGIGKEDIHNIFEVFTVSGKTATPAGGRGLGLALCKEVIEAHGGTIRAESNGFKGTAFRSIIPL